MTLCAGTLSKITSLLSTPVDCIRVLCILPYLTQHGDSSARLEVLRSCDYLFHAIQNQNGNPALPEYAIVALAHSVDPMYRHGVDAPTELDNFPITTLLDVILDLLRPSESSLSHSATVHAIVILRWIVDSCPWEMVDNITPALRFFAGFLRCDNISLRSVALHPFCALYPKERHMSNVNVPGPYKYALEDLPPGVRHIVEGYGVERCETTLFARVRGNFLAAARNLLSDGDLYNFGTTIAQGLVECRDAIDFRDVDLPNPRDLGLPFASWESRIPAAADVVRTHSGEHNSDMADVLHLELLSFRHSRDDVVAAFARNVLARNPRHIYAHIMLYDSTADREEALGVARNALDLLDASPYTRRLFLRMFFHSSVAKAWTILSGASPHERQVWMHGSDILEEGIKAAESYISGAPPDCRDSVDVLDQYITWTFLLKGAKVGRGLASLQVRVCRSSVTSHPDPVIL